jgi:hypothetical protein
MQQKFMCEFLRNRIFIPSTSLLKLTSRKEEEEEEEGKKGRWKRKGGDEGAEKVLSREKVTSGRNDFCL